jgi:PKD repeat protein
LKKKLLQMKNETTSTRKAWNGKYFVLLLFILVMKSADMIAQTPTCNANFIYTISPTNPGGVYFVSSINPPHSTFVWDFGDGTGYNHALATHTYTQSGAYTVCLTVTDSSGGSILCTDTWCDTVHINIPPPVCNAHFVYYHGSNPLNIHFASGGNPAGSTYAWDFGDGSTGSQQFPQHTYAMGGSYNVCLTVTDSMSGVILCSSTWCDTIGINIPPPVCNANFNHYYGSHPGEIHFSGANNPAGTTYAWNFGDNSSGSGHSPSHIYSQSGTYYACLTVTDSSNGMILCMATWCDSIHVTIPVPVCNANFSHYTGSDPGEMHFYGAANPPGTTYAWNFGDNTTGSGHSPSHTYSQSGTYYACLTVTDSLNGNIFCTATFCDSVHVTVPPPVCNAHFHHSNGTNIGDVRFSGSLNPPGRVYTWDFGDGTSGTGRNLIHSYSAFNTYYVCLTVSDTSAGNILCTATWCDSIRVNAPVCNADFDFNCDHHSMNIHFEPEQEHHSSYEWDFGDSNTSNVAEPNHMYAQAGSYNVCLTVTDSFAGGVACTATYCDTINVGSHHCDCEHHHHHNDRLRSTTSSGISGELMTMLYPNPMSESAVLHLENTSGPVTFHVFDNSGRLVMSKENLTDGDFQINRNDLVEGLYFYRITDENNNAVNGKLVIE